jgi:hypothetical protein
MIRIRTSLVNPAGSYGGKLGNSRTTGLPIAVSFPYHCHPPTATQDRRMKNPTEAGFDPYRKWLGIPKTQGPPTYFQLLGLAPGESDTEVIEEAAIRQTKHVRAYQIGPHAELSTRLLNEIAQARHVLLDPRKRASYERKIATAVAMPVEAETTSAFSNLNDDTAISDTPVRRSRRPASSTPRAAAGKGLTQPVILALGAGGGFLVVLAIALVAILLLRPTAPIQEAVAETSKPVPVPVPPTPAPKSPALEPKRPVVVTKSPVAEPKPPVVEAKPPVVEPKPAVEAAPMPVVKEPPPTETAPVDGPRPFKVLGTYGINTTAQQLVVLENGHVFMGGPAVRDFDPRLGRFPRAFTVPRPGERGFRFAVHPDGEIVYLAIPDRDRLLAYDVNGTQKVLFRGSGAVSALALSRDGKRLIAGNFAGQLFAYDTESGAREQIADHPRPVRTIAFSNDGNAVASLCDAMVQVWSLKQHRTVSAGKNPGGAVSLAFEPDDRNFLAGSPAGLHRTATNKIAFVLSRPAPDRFLKIAFASNRSLVGMGSDGLALYEFPSYRILRETKIAGAALDTMALSPDGRALFAGTLGPTLHGFAIDEDGP